MTSRTLLPETERYLDLDMFVDVTTEPGRRGRRVDLYPDDVLVAENGRAFQVVRHQRGGVGGNSTVFEGREVDEEGRSLRSCAIKFQRVVTGVRLDRFRNEVRIHRELDHPRIAAFYGDGEFRTPEAAIPWIAMDLGGDNLRVHVQRRGPLGLVAVRRVGLQMCEALVYLHAAGFLHRDVKPNNFVWKRPETEDEVAMIDFGIAKLIGEDSVGRFLESSLTRTMEFVGPQSFCSPELLRYAGDKTQNVDERSDLFQLGLVLWFLGTGDIFSGVVDASDDPTGGRLFAAVSPLLRANPDRRPASAAEVVPLLEALRA